MSFKLYITGFLFSILLTLVSYFAVTRGFGNALIIILTMSVLQLVVQLYFFLHPHKGHNAGWNLASLLSTLSIIMLIVAGSLWIMNNLNYRHSHTNPHDMDRMMMEEEGMDRY